MKRADIPLINISTKIVNGTIMKGLCDDPGDNWEIWDACSSVPNLAYVISEPSCWPFLTSFVKLWHLKDYVSKQFSRTFHHEKVGSLNLLNNAAFNLFN